VLTVSLATTGAVPSDARAVVTATAHASLDRLR
jgi:hypothetical protein